MFRVLIVGDIRLYSEGLAEVLGRRSDMKVVGIAANRHECLDGIAASAPDVALIDMAMAESLMTVKMIRAQHDQVKIVALAVPEIEREIVACAEAGVVGYVPREATLADLAATVLGAARGECRCSPAIAATFVQRISRLAARELVPDSPPLLTARESEIVALIDRGLSNKEIAKELGLSPFTVKNHVQKTMHKLKVHHRSEAAAWMRRQLDRRSVL